MPGPGGGARGGGGSRGSGGFSGGGFHGGGHRGGFGGGHHSPHHRGGFHGPHFGGGFHRPHFGGGWYRRPRYGGGCFGNIIGIIVIALILIFTAMYIIFIPSIGDLYSSENTDGVNYDENTFQDYANAQYQSEFGSSSAYEDNILLVFLTEDESYYDYYYIAWVGDHIATDINHLFGNENTQLGQSISDNVNVSSYKYSLDSNLAQVITDMKEAITSKNLESSFTCEEQHKQIESHLTNKTSIEMTSETVNAALKSFTDATGIPIVIVVDEIDNVFPSQSTTQSFMLNTQQYGKYIVVGLIVIGFIAALLIINSRRKKELQGDDN